MENLVNYQLTRNAKKGKMALKKQQVTKKELIYTMREWLRTLRKQKGYSQEFMGKKLCVTRQQYNFIENMKRQEDLKLIHAIRISKVLKISLKRICEYEEALKERANETHSSI